MDNNYRQIGRKKYANITLAEAIFEQGRIPMHIARSKKELVEYLQESLLVASSENDIDRHCFSDANMYAKYIVDYFKHRKQLLEYIEYVQVEQRNKGDILEIDGSLQDNRGLIKEFFMEYRSVVAAYFECDISQRDWEVAINTLIYDMYVRIDESNITEISREVGLFNMCHKCFAGYIIAEDNIYRYFCDEVRAMYRNGLIEIPLDNRDGGKYGL